MKLTVAIPTFKRPVLLARCVKSVLASIGELEVELLICDDSTDSTNEVVYADILALNKNVRVINNERNLGIDKNICSCVENATGEYVWLLGEDDLMRTSGISTVLGVIYSGRNYPFIFVNYSYISADQAKELRHRSIEEDREELSFKDFLDIHLWAAGFIGGCVINKSKFIVADYQSFFGTYFSHIAGICLSSIDDNIGIVPSPQVGNRVGDASTFTWSTDSFGVFQGWRVMLHQLREVIGDEHYARAYRSHIKAHGYLKYKFLIAKKADGLLTPKNIEFLLHGETSKDEQRRLLFVAAGVPKFVCTAIRRMHAAARRTSLAPFRLV